MRAYLRLSLTVRVEMSVCLLTYLLTYLLIYLLTSKMCITSWRNISQVFMLFIVTTMNSCSNIRKNKLLSDFVHFIICFSTRKKEKRSIKIYTSC